MFKITMLPAGRGDCLWIEYGKPEKPHLILIDGGIGSTERAIRERLKAIPGGDRHLELLVVSHIDLDHIGGILELLRDPPANLTIGDIWLNAWDQLPDADDGILGAKQGESLSAQIESQGLTWNEAFGGHPVAISGDGELPEQPLKGGMKLTLLSPTLERLRELRPEWKREIRKAGLEPGQAGRTLEGLPQDDDDEELGILGAGDLNVEQLAESDFKADKSEANGSSIAFLAEFEGKRCVFTGDAFAPDLAASLEKLAESEGEDRLRVDALKLSHHGGQKNTSRELLETLHCNRYLISTDGSYYHHPKPESISRLLRFGNERQDAGIYFNYYSDETKVWTDRGLCRRYGYTPVYPDPGELGSTVAL